MNCTMCYADSGVIDSRLMENGNVRRRRRCKKCGHRWTTYEIIEDDVDKNRRAIRRLKEMRAVLTNALNLINES